MKRYKRFTMALVFSICLVGVVYAQHTEPPSDYGIEPESFQRVAMTGWQFLKIPADARQVSMGGVGASIGRATANATLYNPAELVEIDRFSLAVNVVDWFADVTPQAAAFAYNTGRFGVVGVSVFNLDYGDMPRTEFLTIDDPAAPTGQRNAVSRDQGLDLGTFGAGDLAVGVSYARSVTDRLSVGANIRYLHSYIDDLDMSNYSFDIGTFYYTGFRTLRLSLVASNFGPDVKLVKYNEEIQREPDEIKMPTQIRMGTAIDLIEGGDTSSHLLTFAVEAMHPSDGPNKLNLGLEYSFMEVIQLRGGYRFNYDEQGLTLGAGLGLSLGGTSLAINYAFADFGNLDYIQMFSLGVGF